MHHTARNLPRDDLDGPHRGAEERLHRAPLLLSGGEINGGEKAPEQRHQDQRHRHHRAEELADAAALGATLRERNSMRRGEALRGARAAPLARRGCACGRAATAAIHAILGHRRVGPDRVEVDRELAARVALHRRANAGHATSTASISRPATASRAASEHRVFGLLPLRLGLALLQGLLFLFLFFLGIGRRRRRECRCSRSAADLLGRAAPRLELDACPKLRAALPRPPAARPTPRRGTRGPRARRSPSRSACSPRGRRVGTGARGSGSAAPACADPGAPR